MKQLFSGLATAFGVVALAMLVIPVIQSENQSGRLSIASFMDVDISAIDLAALEVPPAGESVLVNDQIAADVARIVEQSATSQPQSDFFNYGDDIASITDSPTVGGVGAGTSTWAPPAVLKIANYVDWQIETDMQDMVLDAKIDAA